MIPPQHEKSVLFITLDSCRFDTFESADVPHLKGVGTLYKAMAPATFTYASHCAMFVGFTPGVAERAEPFINPKFGKIFKMVGSTLPAKGTEHITLEGKNIIDGFARRGYRTIGSGAMGWFNPDTQTGQMLSRDFEHFWFPRNSFASARQVKWIEEHLGDSKQPAFVFMNVGETHVPYYFEGAPWDENDNPCIPFSNTNNAAECRRRQRMCVEYVDKILAPLIAAFANGTILICGDHGDCWGEDGLWEHGIHHPKVFEVPLLFRLGKP